jgi:hypothetical protein
MMPKRSLNPKEIIGLLSKLKSETPEYPADMLEARKATFLQQAATLKIPGKGQGGEGGQQSGNSGSGGSGPALGGGTAAQGFLLQALIGFAVVAAMLLTAFAYREQIREMLNNRNEVALAFDTATSSDSSTPVITVSASPRVTGFPSSTSTVTPSTTTGLEVIDVENITVVGGTQFIDGTLVIAGTMTNPGLHLGQTPGTPAAPGHGNPSNQNKPVKTDKPDNPNKPQKTDKPEKPK